MKKIAISLALTIVACSNGRSVSGKLLSAHPAGTSALAIGPGGRSTAPVGPSGEFALELPAAGKFHLRFVALRAGHPVILATAKDKAHRPLTLRAKGPSVRIDVGQPGQSLAPAPAADECTGDGDEVDVQDEADGGQLADEGNGDNHDADGGSATEGESGAHDNVCEDGQHGDGQHEDGGSGIDAGH